jgi:hypothetical protein
MKRNINKTTNPKGVDNMATKHDTKQVKISKVEMTDDKMSGRGGLFFFLRYVENIGFYSFFEKHFHFLKVSGKGLSIIQFIKQILAFFIDGSDLSMTGFDRRKTDEAYAAILENTPDQMASSHQIKRFFRKLILVPNWLYRKILLVLFLWRLHVEKPEIIELFADSTVWDNNDAEKRQGVAPTYKRKKGFQPLDINWGSYQVDAIFRSGDVHCNHGSDFIKAIARLVRAIRKYYKDVPIIVVCDSGFLDDQNFRFLEERLKILFICVGKQYADLKEYVQSLPATAFRTFGQQQESWRYVEFGNRLQSWATFRRCIFTTLETEKNGQLLFEFARTDAFIYTNIGQDKELTAKLIQAGGKDYLKAERIIALNHSRGKGELNHRSLKELATKEQLPFEQFGMNRAYYYFMVISHFLYEAYKRDVTYEVMPITSYPSTFRRRLIDFAAKVISTGGQFILKINTFKFQELNIQRLWELSGTPQPILIL